MPVMTLGIGQGCCCGDASCPFCSDDTSGKFVQITISGMAPAGSCADFDGTYSTSGIAESLPWLDAGTTGTTATVQDLTLPTNVITLPKFTTSGGVDTIDSSVCSWRFESAAVDYDPICGACSTCATECEMDYTAVDGIPCDPMTPSDCNGGTPISPTCDASGNACDCIGFHSYECEADCTQPGDELANPCCSCVFDALAADFLCTCTGTAIGTNPILSQISAGVSLFVYRNSSNDVVVYAYLGLYNDTLGLVQVYSGEYVFTGSTSLTCLTQLDGLALTLTDQLTWLPDTSPVGACNSGNYSACDNSASITLTIDLV